MNQNFSFGFLCTFQTLLFWFVTDALSAHKICNKLERVSLCTALVNQPIFLRGSTEEEALNLMTKTVSKMLYLRQPKMIDSIQNNSHFFCYMPSSEMLTVCVR
jgi:hypothetical protein